MPSQSTLVRKLILVLALALFGLPAVSSVEARKKKRRRRSSGKTPKGKKPKISRTERRVAKRLFRAATRLYKKERFREAAALFKKAFLVWPRRNIQLNIAICYAELEQPILAIVHLRKALTIAGKPAEQILNPKEYARLLEGRSKVAVVVIKTPDPTAEIFFRRKLVGRGSVDIVVNPGAAWIEVKVNGETKATKVVEVKGGGELKWAMTEWPRTAPVLPSPTDKKSGKRKKLSIAYFASTASVALAGVLALVATGVRTQQKANDFNRTGDPADRREGKRYRLATNVLVGVTVAAAASAITLAIFTDWSLGKKKESTGKSAVVAPYVGRRQAGLVLTGRF